MERDQERSHLSLSGSDPDQDWDTTFESLFFRFSDPALRIAYWITGSVPDAQDVAQEAFARCYVQGPRLDRGVHLGTWINRVVVNTAIDHLRRLRRLKSDWAIVDLAAPVSEQPDVSLDHRRARDQVAKALESLSPDERTAVVLHFLEGFTSKQIEEVGLSKERVKAGVEKLRVRLRDLPRFEPAGEFLEGSEQPPVESPHIPELLREALALVAEARGTEDEVAADDAAMRLDAVLAELFVFRDRGVGFAMVINSLQTALRHRQHFMTDPEWSAVTNVLSRLLRGTDISESAAIDEIAELSSTGLIVVPSAIERLVELGGE